MGNPTTPGLPGEWLRGPLPTQPAWATHLPAPLLDGADGQRALDAPVPPQEHLPLVGLKELRLGLGLGSLHAQADHLGKGNGSSVGAEPRTACDAPSPAPASALPRWLPGSLGAGLTLRRVSVVEVLTTGIKVSL